jgi:cytidyltransferase-like protein
VICGYLACTFDLFNVGDLDVIQQARELCDRLTLGVYPDALVALRTGLPTVVPLTERVALLQHVKGVDAVVVHDENGTTHIDRADRIFVVDGDPLAAALGIDGHRLVPRRRTASREVAEALAPQVESGVA